MWRPEHVGCSWCAASATPRRSRSATWSATWPASLDVGGVRTSRTGVATNIPIETETFSGHCAWCGPSITLSSHKLTVRRIRTESRSRGMLLNVKTVVVTAIAAGGLATGAAGASPAHPADSRAAVAAASAEEQQLHASIVGLTSTQHQLDAVLAARVGSRAGHPQVGAPVTTTAPPGAAPTTRPPASGPAPIRSAPAATTPPAPPAGGWHSGPASEPTTAPTASGAVTATEPPAPPQTTVPPQTTTTTTAPPRTTTTTTQPNRWGTDD